MSRQSGVLLSVTSLPSRYGIGCFSDSAYRFVDWLAKTGQRYWQILPIGASSHGSADSPYQAYSAFAGNPYLISLEVLIDQGVLTREECDRVCFGTDPRKVDYGQLHQNRRNILRMAYERSSLADNSQYRQFTEENIWWLDDFSLFMAVKRFLGGQPWNQWPQDIRMHRENAIGSFRQKLHDEIEFEKYLQFVFFTQWQKLKEYAGSKNIEIVGDIPIYVSGDSADVWAHPELFQLDEDNRCIRVAGCPPDDFTPDGQLWGNPLYRWDYHKKTGYRWWLDRLQYSFRLYDVVRIDHFRGFDAYYSIPAGSRNARNGAWVKGPGMDLFDTVREKLGEVKVIAEDLGFMTQSVREMVAKTGFPNMKVLEFAFDPKDQTGENEYLPHNYSHNCVVYTGTHDNMTVSGWLQSLKKNEQKQIRDYIGDHKTPVRELYKKLVDLALSSVADLCIIPMQDWLGLDNSCRMNTPGTVGTNWQWRLTSEEITPELTERVLESTMRYGRVNRTNLLPLRPEDTKISREEQNALSESLR